MDWTNEKVIELIQAVETLPIIWDSSSREYKNKNRKHDAILELSSYQVFKCDTIEVKRKLKIIVAQFRREKKKVTDSKSSGAGANEVYKPKWFGFDYLGFLNGKDDPNLSVNSHEEIHEQLSRDINEQAEHGSEEFSNEIVMETFKVPKSVSKRRANNEDPRISHALSIMQNVTKQIEARKKGDEDIFAAAVATKLRKINDERTKILVQRDIDNLLYDAIVGTGKYSPLPSPHSVSSASVQNNENSSNSNELFYYDSDGYDIVKM